MQIVITKLIGGLGNQLFQYAAGRAISLRSGAPLRLDLASFSKYPLREFRLDHFHIQGARLTDEEREGLGLSDLNKSVWARFRRGNFYQGHPAIIKEKRFDFDERVLQARPPCYLDGYWQSEKYFRDVEKLIRSELKLKQPPSGENLRLAAEMGSCSVVAVHVRRGDYANIPETNRFHGTCGLEYYSAAEEILLARCENLRLLVFSDDAEWVEKNVNFRTPFTIVRHNGAEKDYEDLRLMTLCSHHVIANSTFSWWGAWLCLNPTKIVIAPKNWFREANHKADDLIPERWIRI